MMGKPNQLAPKLFYENISLERRIPEDYPLRKIRQLVDFSFVRSEVADLYGTRGNESVDPVVILKLMFLLFYENIKSERVLMAQLPMRMDWLWFCEYDLDEKTPNHSVISKARRRWGLEVFTGFFDNILTQCIQAGLVDGETIHVDSSMIDANASKDTLKCQFRAVSSNLYEELESNAEPMEQELERRVSTTDPDARLGKKYGKTTLGYKDHRAVDDKYGIVTATVTTPANVNDEKVLVDVINEHQTNTRIKVETTVTDKAYGVGENYKYCHEQKVTPCIGHKCNSSNCHPAFNHDKFIYDNERDCYICPAGKPLKRKQLSNDKTSVIYRAGRETCEKCQYFKKCVTSKQAGRQIQRNLNQDYIDWADNCLTKHERKRLMARRKHKSEGSFADAANNHGFKRARFRGIEKMQIQNLMIAAIQNMRKLMRHISLGPTVAIKNVVCIMRLLAFSYTWRASFHQSRFFTPNLSEYLFFKEQFTK
jgi:transposase